MSATLKGSNINPTLTGSMIYMDDFRWRCRRLLNAKRHENRTNRDPDPILVFYPAIARNIIRSTMKRGLTIFLQALILLFAVGVFAFLLWEPHLEGRNVNATLFEIYFKDPFLAYIYLAFVPLFVALYQGFNILGYAGREGVFDQHSVRALRIIKYCALTTAIFILGAEAYLFIFIRGKDDIAGGVMMGVFVILVSAIIATAAAVFERILKKASG